MKTIIISIKILLVMILLTGVIYPVLITVIGQTAFHQRSNGSLIVMKNKTVGSELIGQQFESNQYFSSRPSAIDYNPLPSGASNLSVTSKELQLRVRRNTAEFDSLNQLPENQIVPSEMLYASGSGLDPHISPAAALLQVDRIVKARNLSETTRNGIVDIINYSTEGRQLGFLGEERVNVLKLNLELDKQFFTR